MKQLFLNLRVIFGALLAGQVLLLLVFWVLRASNPTASVGLDDTMLVFAVPAVMLSTMAVSRVLTQTRLGAVRSEGTTVEKFTAYRMDSILRYALAEGANIFAIVVFFLTGKLLVLAFLVLGLYQMWEARPSKNYFLANYKLSTDQQMEVERELGN
jgi:hypothetical protein